MQRPTLLAVLCLLGVGRAEALYDPPPDAALCAAQGKWTGTLTYRDYQKPDLLVKLPTILYVALTAPAELALSFTFDDGPTKTVYSYERLSFDTSRRQIQWTTGSPSAATENYAMTSATRDAGNGQWTFERRESERTRQYSLEVGPHVFTLEEQERDTHGASTFRNRYEFSR